MKITLQKIKGTLVPYSDEDMERLNKLSDAVYQIDIKNMDMRTLQQNKAYWKWCNLISETLNDSGLYLNDVLKLETMWNKDNIHANIMLPVIKNIFNKKSSTELKTNEYEHIIDVVTKAFAQKKITIPNFPNREVWDEIKNKEK